MKSLVIILCLCFQFSFSQEELKHEVYFETDQHDIPETEHSRLLLFLTEIEDIDIQKISIYGFTDDRGSDNYNLVLSQNRAESIKEVFSNNEFDESVITNVDGKGEILVNVIHEENLSKIRGLNRKVEIIVTKKVAKPKQKAKAKKIVARPKNQKTTQDIANGNVKEGDKIRLENIYFKTGYATLAKDSKTTLEDIAKILIEQDNIYFSIEGHVCCTQNSRDAVNRKTNQRNLSLARAKFIYDYLIKKGVNKRRMRYIGMRRKFPLGGDPKFDRRVEILITFVGEKR